MIGSLAFVLQSASGDLSDVAPQAEAAGFDGIAVSDHPGSTWSPFVALASAVGSTEQLSLGTAVVNCGVREPLDLASDTATLQMLSGGRVVLGLGAGHTPSEWSQIGRRRPSPSERVHRLEEVVRSVIALLDGQTVSLDGRYVTLRDARLEVEATNVPSVLIGGGNPRLVRLGCELGDVVELSGIGRTLPDGHHHEPRWSTPDVDGAIACFEAGCDSSGRRPVLGALVQHVELTDDAERAAHRYLDGAGRVVSPELLPSVDELLDCPYVLIGTPREVADKLTRLRERWGFSRYTVRSLEPLIEVFAALGRP